MFVPSQKVPGDTRCSSRAALPRARTGNPRPPGYRGTSGTRCRWRRCRSSTQRHRVQLSIAALPVQSLNATSANEHVAVDFRRGCRGLRRSKVALDAHDVAESVLGLERGRVEVGRALPVVEVEEPAHGFPPAGVVAAGSSRTSPRPLRVSPPCPGARCVQLKVLQRAPGGERWPPGVP